MKTCKSCSTPIVTPQPPVRGDERCPACRSAFQRWLRGDRSDVYRPRHDGVWKDGAELAATEADAPAED